LVWARFPLRCVPPPRQSPPEAGPSLTKRPPDSLTGGRSKLGCLFRSPSNAFPLLSSLFLFFFFFFFLLPLAHGLGTNPWFLGLGVLQAGTLFEFFSPPRPRSPRHRKWFSLFFFSFISLPLSAGVPPRLSFCASRRTLADTRPGPLLFPLSGLACALLVHFFSFGDPKNKDAHVPFGSPALVPLSSRSPDWLPASFTSGTFAPFPAIGLGGTFLVPFLFDNVPFSFLHVGECDGLSFARLPFLVPNRVLLGTSFCFSPPLVTSFLCRSLNSPFSSSSWSRQFPRDVSIS